MFLEYMNNALRIYKDHPEVWHINGFNYPINNNAGNDCIFLRIMLCWGWATWKDRWSFFRQDTQNMINEIENSGKKFEFNLKGNYRVWMV